MCLKEDESLSKDEMIRRYLESYDQFVKSDYYIACIQFERDQRVYNTGLENSKNEGIQEGISIGRELGFALGKEQGISIGKELGFALGKELAISIGEEKEKKIFH
ncbi:MAG: hypothetical protein ACLUVC_09595 [Longibaculum sp.]